MDRPIDDTIARALAVEHTAAGKVMPLAQAVQQFLQPGMQLHLGGGLGGPGAAICEIIRRFWGTEPGFELIQCILSGHVLNLIHGRLARKLIFTASAGSGKSRREIQKAFAARTIEFENWSLCTLQQRLMAGALGVGFMPTRSIAGSSMARDNTDGFRELDDPFTPGAKVGVVKALNPDISFVHGCVADVFGHTILPAPYGDEVWGPLASHGGVVVTVEQIVPSAFIRRHAALVKIPAHIVRAVCPAPLGLHPFAMTNPGISEFDAYGTDGEFLGSLTHAAAEDRQDDWIRQWVLDCPTHADYLKKLGAPRINGLRGQVTANLWDYRNAFPAPPPATEAHAFGSDELTPIIAAREIVKSIRAAGLRTMLAGAGAGMLAAWLAYFQLRAAGDDITLIQGNGQIGYLPQPAQSLLHSGAMAPSAHMLSDTITTQAVLVGGRFNRCISLLGAGEIDRCGNINSTLTTDGLFLSGSGGGNDAANASEVIIVLEQSRRRFVDKLVFVTCPGERVTKVISSLAVFEKPPGENELYLTGCFPDAERPLLAERIRNVQAHCGWTIRVAPNVADIPAPEAGELQLLRSLLPAAMA